MTVRVIAVLICLMAGADAAGAATREWSGGAGTRNWSTPGNWAGGIRPVSGDSLFFGGDAALAASENDIPGLTVVSITINNTADEVRGRTAFRLLGLPITVTSHVTVSSPPDRDGASPWIALTMRLGGPVTIRNAPFHTGARARLDVTSIELNGFALTFDTQVAIEAGGISGTGSITKQGADGLTLHAGTYTGPTRVTQGDLTILDGTALGLATGVNDHTVLEQGTRLIVENDATIDEPLVIRSGITVAALQVPNGRVATFNGPISVESDTGFFADTNAQLSIAGRIVAPGLRLVMYGDGTLVLSHPDNLWRLLSVEVGTVRLGGANGLARTAGIELLSVNATLDLNNFNATAFYLGSPALGGGGFDEGLVKLGSGTLTLEVPPGQGTFFAVFAGRISGTGGLVVTGPLLQIFQGPRANTYTGTTRVQDGALGLNKPNDVTAIAGPIVINGGKVLSQANNQIAATAPVTVNAPGVFEQAGQIESFGSLAGTGIVDTGTGRLVVGGNNTSTTFAGSVKGTALMKIGTGTLTMTGASTMTLTTISEGRLIVNGSLRSNAFVQLHGGILGGAGSVGTMYDATVVPFETTISPGASPGILHAAESDLRHTVVVIELNGPNAGTGYDQLDFSGNVILGGGMSSFGTTLFVTRTYGSRAGTVFTIVNVAAGRTVTGTFDGLPEGAPLTVAGQPFSITYRGGDGNDVVLTALADAPDVPPPPPPPGSTRSYFLAEGATGGFFDDDVLIANPNDAEAPVTLTFFKENGEQVVTTRTLTPRSHLTVHVDQLDGLSDTAASVQVTSTDGLRLAVERTMFWNDTSYAGHTGSAIGEPKPDWFFAEGSQGFFDTFILVVNPNAAAADVTFTFLLENESPVTRTMPLAAFSRLTLHTGSVPEIVDRSFGITVHATQPIMAERAMYFGTTAARLWSGGHESAGVTAPSTNWFLAEGATGSFFDTFILLSNPQSTAAQVTLDYLLDTGEPIRVTKTIAPHARVTTNIEAEGDPRLRDAAVSTVVTSDVPIIAERSMYWPGAAAPWGEGHNSFGVTQAATAWSLAEGRLGGPLNFHTYILLANPQSSAAEVTVTYLRENGPSVVKTYVVPAASRFTIDTSSVAELQHESFGADIVVTNSVPIVVERSLYWDAHGFVFSGGTNATGTAVP